MSSNERIRSSNSCTTRLTILMNVFQSKQLDYDRSGDRTRDFKYRSTLTIPLHHRVISSEYLFFSFFLLKIKILLIFNFLNFLNVIFLSDQYYKNLCFMTKVFTKFLWYYHYIYISLQLSACTDTTCQNDGTCVPDTSPSGFSCQCQPGTSGNLCEVIDVCMVQGGFRVI